MKDWIVSSIGSQPIWSLSQDPTLIHVKREKETLGKLGIEGKFLKWVKVILEEFTVNVIFNLNTEFRNKAKMFFFSTSTLH